MAIAGLGSKYASAYETRFDWKDFPNRLHLIKTNTTLNRDFYKIFARIYFLRREINTDIAQTGFRVLRHLAIRTLIKKWFNSSKANYSGDVKHNKSLY